jgi:hypothetical protein
MPNTVERIDVSPTPIPEDVAAEPAPEPLRQYDDIPSAVRALLVGYDEV